MRKLVRDKIPRMMLDEGLEPNVRVLSTPELDKALRKKLVEEAHEVIAAATPEALLEELADLWEVWYTLIRHHDWLAKDAYERARDKGVEKGRFQQGFEVDVPAHPNLPHAISGVGLDHEGNEVIFLPKRVGGRVVSEPATKHVGVVAGIRFYLSNGETETLPLVVNHDIAVGDVLAVQRSHE